MEKLGNWDPLKVRMYYFTGITSLARRLAIHGKLGAQLLQ